MFHFHAAAVGCQAARAPEDSLDKRVSPDGAPLLSRCSSAPAPVPMRTGRSPHGNAVRFRRERREGNFHCQQAPAGMRRGTPPRIVNICSGRPSRALPGTNFSTIPPMVSAVSKRSSYPARATHRDLLLHVEGHRAPIAPRSTRTATARRRSRQPARANLRVFHPILQHPQSWETDAGAKENLRQSPDGARFLNHVAPQPSLLT